MVLLCEQYSYKFATIKKNFRDISSINSSCELKLRVEIPSTTLLIFDPSPVKPGLSLSAPENDQPTMDIHTFQIIGEDVQTSTSLRLVYGPIMGTKRRKIYRKDKYEAAWASAYFGRAMQIEDPTRKRHDQPQNLEADIDNDNEKTEVIDEDTGFEGMMASLNLSSQSGGENSK
jgi:hypothetical protein